MIKFIIANIAMADIGGVLYMLSLGGGWWGSTIKVCDSGGPWRAD